MKWLGCIDYHTRVSNRVLVFLKLGLTKKPLVRLPIRLMMGWKLEIFAAIDALLPKKFIRTDAFNNDKRGSCLCGNGLSTLIGDSACQRTITDHTEALQELTASDVEHDRIGERPSSLHGAIQEIFDIVFIYQGPNKLSTQSTGQRAFPAASKAFHGNEPQGHRPFSLKDLPTIALFTSVLLTTAPEQVLSGSDVQYTR